MELEAIEKRTEKEAETYKEPNYRGIKAMPYVKGKTWCIEYIVNVNDSLYY